MTAKKPPWSLSSFFGPRTIQYCILPKTSDGLTIVTDRIVSHPTIIQTPMVWGVGAPKGKSFRSTLFFIQPERGFPANHVRLVKGPCLLSGRSVHIKCFMLKPISYTKGWKCRDSEKRKYKTHKVAATNIHMSSRSLNSTDKWPTHDSFMGFLPVLLSTTETKMLCHSNNVYLWKQPRSR